MGHLLRRKVMCATASTVTDNHFLLHQIVKIARRRLPAGAGELLVLCATDLAGCLQMLQPLLLALI
jgi:hypothetical protein